MADKKCGLQRRQFLKSGLLAAGGAALAGGIAPSAEAKEKQVGGALPMKIFGKTGATLPILGMGGSAMVGRFIASYGLKLIPMEERIAMVRHAYERGIRYFDTARVYGESEEIMGQGLKGVRDQVFLATKVAEAEPARIQKSIETSLEKLGTDHVDLVQIHSPVIERVGFEKSMKIHAELVKLRDQKLLRFIGLTTHVAYETVYRMIATGGFDEVLLAYGYFRKGMDTLLSNRNLEYRELCLAKAHELNMGIVAMKVMGASILGHNAKNVVKDYDKEALEKLPAAAIRWVLQDRRVCMLNIGVSLPADIDKNVNILKGDLRVTSEDRQVLADFAGKAYESETVKKMRTV